MAASAGGIERNQSEGVVFVRPVRKEMRVVRQRPSRGRGRRRAFAQRLPLWAKVILVLCAVGLATLIVVRVRQHDALTRWRQSLELQGERVEWPAWDPKWPALPSFPTSRRARRLDVTGPAAFAARNAEVMRHIPCYCGACPVDHRSNLSCYVTGFRTDGTPLWTDHASTCPICVHVTREVMLMTQKGWSLQQIRETLDREYARGGRHPSTSTPLPPQSHQTHRLGPDHTGAHHDDATAALSARARELNIQ